MPKFRKRPVIIEARQFTLELDLCELDSLVDWCNGAKAYREGDLKGIVIDTLEGEMFASPGDWIIEGISGEYYPCKPDIFEKTYEVVDA